MYVACSCTATSIGFGVPCCQTPTADTWFGDSGGPLLKRSASATTSSGDVQVSSVQPGCGSRGLLPPAWALLSLRRQLSFSQPASYPYSSMASSPTGTREVAHPQFIQTCAGTSSRAGWARLSLRQVEGWGWGFGPANGVVVLGQRAGPRIQRERRRAAEVQARHVACMQVLYGNTGDTVSFKTLELQPCSALPSNKARGRMLCMLARLPPTVPPLPGPCCLPSCLPLHACPAPSARNASQAVLHLLRLQLSLILLCRC